ncbi:major capsid family protein [Acinetobacter sp. ULE_I001]|uniref:major capsid family protein n=1 Tax=unclassified Acinetobacter TaxID=196816 RepID=UPI003AF60497
MSKELEQMKLRLSAVAHSVKAAVGDAFNLDTFAKLLIKLESVDEMSPQLAEAQAYAKYLPIEGLAGAVVGSASVLQRKRGAGRGKRHSGLGNDVPLAEVMYDEVKLTVQVGVIGYETSIFETAAALKAGIALATDKITATRLAFENHMSDVAWFGEAETGLNGFYNQTGVEVLASTVDYVTATIEVVLADINKAIKGANNASKFDGSVQPDTFVMPENKFTILASRIVPDSAGKTFLEYIKEKNTFAMQNKTLNFASESYLEGKGVGGTDRSIIYRRDPNCITFRCNDLEFLAAQPINYVMRTPGHYMYEGVYLKRVDSLRYYDVE